MECSNVQCIRTGGKCQSIEMDLTNQSHVRFNRWQTLPQLHTYHPRKELKEGSLPPWVCHQFLLTIVSVSLEGLPEILFLFNCMTTTETDSVRGANGHGSPILHPHKSWWKVRSSSAEHTITTEIDRYRQSNIAQWCLGNGTPLLYFSNIVSVMLTRSRLDFVPPTHGCLLPSKERAQRNTGASVASRSCSSLGYRSKDTACPSHRYGSID